MVRLISDWRSDPFCSSLIRHPTLEGIYMSNSVSFLFLGTGAGNANFGTPAAGGLPAKDLRRFTSNFLAPDTLIDFNHHTAEALKTFKVEASEIRHLLISHGHFDHFQPIEILRFAESLPHPLQVYGNNMVRASLEFCRDNEFDGDSKRWVGRRSPYNVEIHVLEPGMSMAIGSTQLAAVQGNHFMQTPYGIMEQQALNFVIQTRGKTLFYGLDSSYLFPATREKLCDFEFDLAIFDATFGSLEIDPITSGHQNWKMLDETIDELRRVGAVNDGSVLVADHISCVDLEPYDQIAEDLAAKGITLAYDGLGLSI